MRRLNGRAWKGGVLPLAAMSLLWMGAMPLRAQASAQAAPGGATGDVSAGGGQGGHRGQYAGMGRVAGEVTAVSGANITVRTETGETAQIVTTDNTRVMKANGPVKVSDLHAGDGLMAIGNLDPATHTLHAAMVMAEDAAQVKAMKENLGKTYITGRVTAINLDEAKMTVERPDHVAQTIGFDESTSFKRMVRGERPAGAAGSPGGGNGGGGGRGFGGGMMMGGDPAAMERAFSNGESITLADIKVGDGVVGTGSVKGGVFVPTHLMDSPRRQRGPEPATGSPTTGSPAAQAAGAGPGGH